MRRFPRRRMLTALAVGLGAFGIASVVQASIPDSQGVIHGCYYKGAGNLERQGALRAVDTDRGQACRADESPVSWNQAGGTGATGPTGPRGPTGPSVPSYVAGSSGGQGIFLGQYYVGVGGYSSTQADVEQVVPVTGTLSNLYAKSSFFPSAPGPTVITFTLYENGAPTALTCTIGPIGPSTECSDTSHSVTVTAGDTVSLGEQNANPSAPTITWAVRTS
jgi:hypothetical protein